MKKLLTLVALVAISALAQLKAENGGASWSERFGAAGSRIGAFADKYGTQLQTGARKLVDTAGTMRSNMQQRAMVGTGGAGTQPMYDVAARPEGMMGAALGDMSFTPTSIQYQNYCKGSTCILRRNTSGTGTLYAEPFNAERTDYVGTSEIDGTKVGLFAEVSAMEQPVEEGTMRTMKAKALRERYAF